MKVSELIIREIKENPKLRLGLATGSTPIDTYELMVKDYKENQTDYSKSIWVNLDEYVGLDKDNPFSYYYFMKKHLTKHIPMKFHAIPNGKKEDLSEEVKKYEEFIDHIGGIDLQILGLGHNGHIGFNEPFTSFYSKTHIVRLDESTRKANSRFFEKYEDVPKLAITMGLDTIFKSKQIILMVSGEEKASILKQSLEGKITEEIPCSILQNHPNVIVIADESACSLLKRPLV